MGSIYVARSAKLGRWASDVGLGRHVYKVGVADGDPKPIVAQGWAGETDWVVVRKREIEDLSEDDALDAARSQGKDDRSPKLYPKLKGAVGVFRLTASQVENHLLVTRALAGDGGRIELKLKPADFADYLIHNALR